MTTIQSCSFILPITSLPPHPQSKKKKDDGNDEWTPAGAKEEEKKKKKKKKAVPKHGGKGGSTSGYADRRINNKNSNITTIKVALLKHLKGPYAKIRPIIEQWVEAVTHLRIEGSRFLNVLLMRIVDQGLDLPTEMDDTFIRLTFSKLLDTGMPRLDSTGIQQQIIDQGWVQYEDTRGGRPMASFGGQGAYQVLTWAAKDYLVNFRNHVRLNFYRRLYGVIFRHLDGLGRDFASVTKSRRREAATVVTKFIVNFSEGDNLDNLDESIRRQLNGRGEGGVAGPGSEATHLSDVTLLVLTPLQFALLVSGASIYKKPEEFVGSELLLTLQDGDELYASIAGYHKRRGGYDEFEVLVNSEETQYFSFRKNNEQETSMSLSDASGNNVRVVETYRITQRFIPSVENQAALDAHIDQSVQQLGERQRDAGLEGHRQRPWCMTSITNSHSPSCPHLCSPIHPGHLHPASISASTE